jgi:hypothetical protein
MTPEERQAMGHRHSAWLEYARHQEPIKYNLLVLGIGLVLAGIAIILSTELFH